MEPISVLVTGATGQQGGALARILLRKGHKVRALTRRPDDPGARDLKRLGAMIVTGDFEDEASLDRAMEGVDAVFAMSTPMEGGARAEARAGIALADAADRADVAHLVYTSVGSADRNTGVPHFDSKYEVEKRIRSLGIPFTIM